MPAPTQRHACLLCYDIKDPKRLRRMARWTEGHGQRVQLSVYEAWLTVQQQHLWNSKAQAMTQAEDALLLLRLCPKCARHAQVLGQGQAFATAQAEWA